MATVTEDIIQMSQNSEITRNKVECEKMLKMVDKNDEGLELFSYEQDVDLRNAENTEFVHQCRGVIFHNDEIVMKSFPKTVEYSCKDIATIKKTLEDIFGECTFFRSEEGTLIRVFNFNGKWYISTHRKLDAFKSKWASKDSFGELFEKAVGYEFDSNEEFNKALSDISGETVFDKFKNFLDVQKQYMFLLRNTTDNRIVCLAPKNPTIYHVGTFINGMVDLNDNIFVTKPRKVNFLDVDDLCFYADTEIDYNHYQGVIVFAPNNKQYKIINNDYQELFNIRGNEPSIKFRYLQVRMIKRQLDGLYFLYPEMSGKFDEYENILFRISGKIHNAYMQRFIKKIHTVVSPEELAVIKACHTWYSLDRNSNRVTREKVIDFMNLQPPTKLNKMVRSYIQEMKRTVAPEIIHS